MPCLTLKLTHVDKDNQDTLSKWKGENKLIIKRLHFCFIKNHLQTGCAMMTCLSLRDHHLGERCLHDNPDSENMALFTDKMLFYKHHFHWDIFFSGTCFTTGSKQTTFYFFPFPPHISPEPAGPHRDASGGWESYPTWEHGAGEPGGGSDLPASVESPEWVRAAERPGPARLPTTGVCVQDRCAKMWSIYLSIHFVRIFSK